VQPPRRAHAKQRDAGPAKRHPAEDDQAETDRQERQQDQVVLGDVLHRVTLQLLQIMRLRQVVVW